MKNETKCIQSGYEPKNGEARVVPISQSTTFKYDTTETVGELFDLKQAGFFYTRLSNPTCAAVEAKLADLEGASGAMLTASGMSATLISILNVASRGDHIISASEIYGGTTNLFAITLKKMGIECTFVNINNLSQIESAIQENTKAIFGESLANPALVVMDIEAVARIAHRYGILLMVDSTFTPPVILKPIDFGADVVIHSSSKYLDGHAVSLGGVILDAGKFDYEKSGRYKDFTTPDESYHGIVYSQNFKGSEFITKARVQLMRDLGPSPAPMNSFLLNLGLETLHLRMERHGQNALKVARFLQTRKEVLSIKYPGLVTDPDFKYALKYFANRNCSGVINFDLGSRERAEKFMNNLKLISIVVHVADVRTGVLHPASSTHRQLNDEQLKQSGIKAGGIRLSVGIENIDDIIEDLTQALDNI